MNLEKFSRGYSNLIADVFVLGFSHFVNVFNFYECYLIIFVHLRFLLFGISTSCAGGVMKNGTPIANWRHFCWTWWLDFPTVFCFLWVTWRISNRTRLFPFNYENVIHIFTYRNKTLACFISIYYSCSNAGDTFIDFSIERAFGTFCIFGNVWSS